MTESRVKSTFLPWTTLLILAVFISSTHSCASHDELKSRESKPKSNYRYHFKDPRYREFIPSSQKHRTIVPNDKLLVPEYELTVARTSCGKTLCANIAYYPLENINKAVDRARYTLRSGVTVNSFRYKEMSYGNFTSKYDSFWYGERAPDHDFVDDTNDCKERVTTIYPQEGYSSDDNKAYYIVNVPTMYRGLTVMTCESNDQMCVNSNDLSTDVSRSCRQMYREEQLLALPINQSYLEDEDFLLKTFHVPTGCACMPLPNKQ